MWTLDQVLILATALGTIVAAFYTARAARQAKRAADATLLAAQGEALSVFLSEYAQPQMQDSLDGLVAYWRENGDSAVLKFQNRALQVDDEKKVDHARRHVHWFYRRAWALFEAGVLNDSMLRALTETNGYTVFHHFALPLSLAKPVQGQPARPDPTWITELRRRFPPREPSVREAE